MTDRTIIFGENGKCSTRGIRQVSEAGFMAWQRDDDTLTYVLDYSNWLGSDTISSVTREYSGTTGSGTSNTTTTATQKLNSDGYLDIKITTAAGMIKQDRIRIKQRSEDGDTLDTMYP